MIGSWVQEIIALVTVLGGGSSIYSLMKINTERRSLMAQAETFRTDSATKLVRSSLDLLEPVEIRAKDLEERLQRSQRRISELETLVRDLRESLEVLKLALVDERTSSRRESSRLAHQSQEALAEQIRRILEDKQQGPETT